MKRNSSSSSVRTFFGSKFFLFFAFLLTIAFTFGFARAYYKDYAFREEVRRLEEDLKKLEKKKLESIELLQYVSSSSYVEDVARTELNMKQPGEQVILLDTVEKNNTGDIRNIRPQTVHGQDVSNPIQWWYYFTKSSREGRR